MSLPRPLAECLRRRLPPGAPAHAVSGSPRDGRAWRFASSVSVAYAVLAAAWILASDNLLRGLDDAALLSRLQTYKGWLFVLLTSGLIYALLSRAAPVSATAAPAEVVEPVDRRLKWFLSIAATALAAVFVLNLAYTVRKDRDDLLREAAHRASSLSHVLAEQVGGMINAIDVTLLGTARAVRLLEGTPGGGAKVHELLREQARLLPYVSAVFVLDARGKLRFDSESFPARPDDYSDREYFRIHGAGAERTLRVGTPLVSRARGVAFIPVSRALLAPDGSFAGVLVASLDPSYLERFFASVGVGRQGAVGLLLRKGAVLAGVPRPADVAEAAAGATTRALGAQDAMPANGQAILDGGASGLVSLRAVADRPVAVLAALSHDEVLAPWRVRAWTYGLISAAFAISMAWLGWLVTRELRRRAALDAALRASEQRFARAFHASPTAQAISEIDTSQFIDVNRRYAELLGYESGYMIGRRALAMGVWHDPAARSALLDGLGEDGSVREARVRLVRKDGAVRDVLLSVVKMRAGRPDRPVLVSLATDITERLAAEREVRRLNADLERRVAERTAELESAVRELEAFSYSVSHDLRAPLRHVDGYASLLTGRLPEGDAVSRKHLRSIVDAVARMGRLIDDLLAFSRAGRAQLRREPVDLDALVAEIVDECARDAAGRSVSWRIAALPVVNGDGALLRQAFVNLLGNALKFTAGREHASIAVEAAAADGEVRICVADNGAGFDMQYADQLFTPFRRLHRADEFKGNGIGLATVRRIVDRHGGRVWAEGVPGGGARFHLALPAS